MSQGGPRVPRWHLLVVAAVAVAVFWPALLGDYVYDDEALIVRNVALHNGDVWALLTRPLYEESIPFWRPLTSLLLGLGHHLGGAAGVHVLSLLLHVVCACLVLRLARRLVGAGQALFVALLFVVHPVQVESVAWCAAINDPLWVLFALLAMRAAVRWRDAGGEGLPWSSAAWVLAAMLSKESGAAAAPMVLAALLWIPPRERGEERPSGWRRGLAMVTGAVVLWLLLVFVRGATAAAPRGGHILADISGPPPSDWLDALHLLVRHLELLVLPLPTTPFRTVPSPSVWWVSGAAMAGTAVAILLWRGWRRRPETRIVPALLLPIALPVLFADFVGAHPLNDRYLYAPVAGLGLLVVGLLPWRRVPWLPWALLVPIGALSFALTWNWQSNEHLASYALAHFPDDPKVNVIAGDAALQRARGKLQHGERDQALWDRARECYRRAEANSLHAPPGEVRTTLADSRLGLAWCLMEEPRMPPVPPQRLVAAFRAAVDVGEDNAAAWIGLGVANGMAGNAGAAEGALRRAIELDPDRTEAWHNLGILQLQLRRREAARQSFEQALRCDPNNAQARQFLEQLGR